MSKIIRHIESQDDKQDILFEIIVTQLLETGLHDVGPGSWSPAEPSPRLPTAPVEPAGFVPLRSAKPWPKLLASVENTIEDSKRQGQAGIEQWMEGFDAHTDWDKMGRHIAQAAGIAGFGGDVVTHMLDPRTTEAWDRLEIKNLPEDPLEVWHLFEAIAQYAVRISMLYFGGVMIRGVYRLGRRVTLSTVGVRVIFPAIAGWAIGTIIDRTVLDDIGGAIDRWIVTNGMEFVYSQIDYIQSPAAYISNLRRLGPEEFNKEIYRQANAALATLFEPTSADMTREIKSAQDNLLQVAEDAGMTTIVIEPEIGLPGATYSIPPETLGGGPGGDHDDDGVVNSQDPDYAVWRSSEIEKIRTRVSRPEFRTGPYVTNPREGLSHRNSLGQLTMLNEAVPPCILCPIVWNLAAEKLGMGIFSSEEAQSRGRTAGLPAGIGIQDWLIEGFNKSINQFMHLIRISSVDMYDDLIYSREEAGLDPYEPPRNY